MLEQEELEAGNQWMINFNKDCSKVVFGILNLMVLTFIAFTIYIIVALDQNSDQEQVRTMCELMIIMLVLMCLSLIFYIYQLRSFIINTQNLNIIQNLYNLESENFSNAFCLRQEQMKFLPIHYLFLNFATALCLLILKLLPTYLYLCRNPDDEQCHCQQNDEDEINCYSKKVDPLFQGPLLSGLAHFSIFIASLIYTLEAVMIFAYIIPIDANKYPISYKQQYIQNTKIQAKLCLMLFFIYSILKIISYIIILVEYQNPSSVILVVSNIYFHLIMILITTRSLILVNQSKQGFYDDFYNYMTLIYNIVEKDKINRCLNILGFLGIPFTIVGAILFETQENKEVIINIEYYIQFDCLGIQIFAATMISLLFLIFPYIKYRFSSMAKQDTKKSPFFQVKEIENGTVCVICLQIMKLRTDLVELGCHKSHIFHQQCIEEWLEKQKTCPICNAHVKYC